MSSSLAVSGEGLADSSKYSMMVCSGARRSSDAAALMGRSWLATRVMPVLSDVADWAETTVLTRAQVSSLVSCGVAEQPAAPSRAPAAIRTVRVFFMVYSGVYGSVNMARLAMGQGFRVYWLRGH